MNTPKSGGSKPNLSCRWSPQVSSLPQWVWTSSCECRGRTQSGWKTPILPWWVLRQTLRQDYQSGWCERTTAKSPARVPGCGEAPVGSVRRTQGCPGAGGGRGAPAPSCPASNAAFSHGMRSTLCAALTVTLVRKKLKILAVLQVNLQNVVKIRASAVKMPHTSPPERLSSASHTLSSDLLCFLFMVQ